MLSQLADTAIDPFDFAYLTEIRLLTVIRLQRYVSDLDSFAAFEKALGLDRFFEVKQWQLEVASLPKPNSSLSDG